MQLNFRTFGQGKPLIILHGLFGSLDNWQTLARSFGKEFQVFTVDQRNHGKSPHEQVMDFSTMATDLFEFMEQQGIQKAHFLGHSMGGKTAMELALLYPGAVEKLVVVDIAPRAYEPGHNAIFEALLKLDPEQLESRQAADEALAKDISSFPIRQFLLKNLARRKEGGFHWKMNLPVIYKNYSSLIAKVHPKGQFEGEALFIRGGKSSYIAPNELPQIKEQFPNAYLVTVDAAGHWVHAEAPEALLNIVTEFLK